jgi:ribokinase
MAGRVFVVGSYNQDLVWEVDALPLPGETRSGHAFRTGPGGKGFNQAIAAARQGAATRFVCALGDDALAEEAQRLALAENIDARCQMLHDVATGTAGIWVDRDGRNSIVVALGANERLAPEHIHAHLSDLHPNDVLLMPMEGPISAMRAAAEAGRRRGACVILNPAPVHAELDAELLSAVDLITPNETEFATLLARFGGSGITANAVVGLSDEQVSSLCEGLTAPAVLVTLGAAGSVLYIGPRSRWSGNETGIWRIGTPVVRAIDTTAAGDAFNGALAAALAQASGTGLRAAAQRASRVAALSTERAGAALSIPSAPEVMQRFG